MMNIYAQNSSSPINKTWFSGNFAIDWNDDEPKIKNVFSINNRKFSENTSFVANPSTGELVLFTDGITLWDQDLNVIDDNIGARYSTHQNSIIAPTNDSTYLIVGNAAMQGHEDGNHLTFTIVQKGKNDNTYKIIHKEEIFDIDVFETLALAPNPEKDCSFWLIFIANQANQIHSLSISESGNYNFQDLQTSTIPNFNEDKENIRGHISMSDDFTKASIGVQFNGIVTADFNSSTGLFSNFSLPLSDKDETGYISLLSPDKSKLYYIQGLFGFNGFIQQYDFDTQETEIISISNDNFGGLQLAPNGKIYASGIRRNYFAVINNPNEAASKVNFKNKGLYLQGYKSSYSAGMLSIMNTNSSCNISTPCPSNLSDTIFYCSEELSSNEITAIQNNPVSITEVDENGCVKTLHHIIQEPKVMWDEITICEKVLIWKDGNHYLAGDTILQHSSEGACTDLKKIIVKQSYSTRTVIDTFICIPGEIFIGNQKYTQAGEFLYHLKNQFGCDSTVSINIHERFDIKETILDTAVCEGTTLELPIDLPTSFLSQIDGYNKNENSILVSNDTFIDTFILNCIGDSIYLSLDIQMLDAPKVQLEHPSKVKEADLFEIYLSSTDSYQLFESGKQISVGTDNTFQLEAKLGAIYEVKSKTVSGCEANQVIPIKVTPANFDCGDIESFIPNYITPNNDGSNDFFEFTIEKINSIKNITIYDRWGAIAFQTKDPTRNLWNGKIQDEPAPQGVYVYKIEVECKSGNNFNLSGNITVLY